MAEAILADRLHDLELAIRVRSRGMSAVGGAADPGARRALESRGLDLSQHRSARVDLDAINDAVLVLAMERAHVAEIATALPAAFAKTFGLTEIVVLGERHGPRQIDEPLETWLDRIQTGRRSAHVLGADANFDIADPYGGTPAAYERCADNLTRLIDAFVRLAFAYELGRRDL